MKKICVGLSLLAAAAAVAPQAAAQEAKLRAGFFIPAPKEPFRIAFMNWIDMINKEGKGILQISQVVGPAAVPGGQWCNFVKAGTLQMVGIPPSYCSNLVPGFEALDAANIPPAKQRQTGVYHFIRNLTATRANAYMLAQYGYGVHYNIYLNKKIVTLADFKGLRFRTNPAYTPLYDALGISGVQMPNGEIYTAMERGVINGYALPPTLIVPFGLNKVTKYRFDPGFYNPTVVVLVNQRTWNTLNDKQKDFMEKMGLNLETDVNNALNAKVDGILKGMVKAGVEPTAPSKEVQEKFIETAYSAMWATLMKRAPKNGAKFRELLTSGSKN